ncbi:hypothetical protein QWY99_21340 [Flavobacterium branchiarum]|uniref:Uncharacterized protein n=1 Tax=Flavobacterium branchiarum TaxID=1114870 RepID=A0ABV5FPN9_9FLAO|nr:hypothetical protein [Flavobacterium branchiarum]MDN3675580.1 hypothetical protein [Flavobacterium branchiarum]
MIMIFTRMNIDYDIRKIALIAPILFHLSNYYYFKIKGNGAIIIKDDSYSLGKYSFLLDAYNIASYILVAITYHFYKEL